MIFKSSTVALVVSAAFSCSANASEVEQANNMLAAGELSTSANLTSERNRSFRLNHETMGVYLIRLTAKSGLDPSYAALGNDRSSILVAVEKQQDLVMAAIRAADQNAVLTRKSKMSENALYVQMNHDVTDILASNEHVVSAQLLSEYPNYTTENEFKKYPFLTIKDVGDDITVAIVGNGIDYTHKALGGTGTVAAFEQATANRSNAWDGFPTDTVIGGLDFSAAGEGYHHVDYNPIEWADDANVEAGALASGTAVAAQVLAQAPDAKIIYYKTWDWSNVYFYPVLDVIVDPNQDGDISDRPDVIVLNSYGNSAFYVEDDVSPSQATRDVGLVRRLSATGSLVVVGAGYTGYDSYFNLAWRAAVPEALTVGSVNVDGESITLSPFTPAGPTRGTHTLKPEVVAPAEHFVGPVAGSGDQFAEVMPHHNYAAAYAAGTAARILAQYPQLSPIEAKALVANTALADGIQGSTEEVFEGATKTTVPEVSFMGTGLVDGVTAVTANAVVWETGTYQPGLAFGYVETPTSIVVTRELTIKNLTDQVQSYTVSSQLNGNKASNDAIGFVFPQTINIPANRSVSFPISLTIDAENLAEWPFKQGTDLNIENWIEAAINGYLVFDNTSAESAQLKLPFQVFPKSNAPLVKSNFGGTTKVLLENDEWQQMVRDEGNWVESSFIDLTNSSNSAKTFFAMPLMHNVPVITPSKVGGQGNMIKNIGANIVNEDMCEISGKKLSVVVQMFDKFDVPMAEHFDKAGHMLTWFKTYTEEHADSYNDTPFEAELQSEDVDKIFAIDVRTNNDGVLETVYIDFNMEFNPWISRKKVSKLTTDISAGDDTVVANVCLEELYHGDIQSLEAFNQKMGWQFATDRDAQASIAGPLIRFNPVIHGDYFAEVVDHEGEYNYPPYTYQYCDSSGTDWSGNPRPEDYCLEEKMSFLATTTGVALIPEDYDVETPFDWSNWSNKVVIQPGQSARVLAGLTYQCNPSVVTTNGIHVTHKDCPPGGMLFEMGNDNTGFSNTVHGADARVKSGQSFDVYENVENGHVIGKVAMSTEQFFMPSTSVGEIFLVNALPGTPFAVSVDGVISVANADAIDYEEIKSYTLKIVADYINRDAPIVEVEVVIANSNDIAPVVVASIAAVSAVQGEQINANVSANFADAENDGITFTANNLPAGLTISLAGQISGSVTVAGDYSSTITANDGVNSTSTDMVFSVSPASVETTPVETTPVETTPVATSPSNSTPNQANPTSADAADETKSSGGSTGLFFILLSALGFAARRVYK